jgi:adenylate cyclase
VRDGANFDARGALTELFWPGEGEVPGWAMWRFGSVALAVIIVVTNVVGACAILVIGLLVLPNPHDLRDVGHVRVVDALVAAGYVAFAVPLGVVVGTRRLWGLRSWILEERPATLTEIRLVLQAPLRLFGLQLGLWAAAAVVFGILNSFYSARMGVGTAVAILLTGLVTGSLAYLLSERLLRSPAARALSRGAPGRLAVPGVTTRALLAWALGTGIPVLGLVSFGIVAFAGGYDVTVSNLRVAMVVLGGTGIAVGLLATILAARTTADPISSVRRALARVQKGDFDVRVPVYDGSQIGQLQLGFNEMVAGLAERERIREAFGTYVDQEVAAHILEEGVDLAGEEVEVTLMFIDVRDFTGFAEQTPANEVVGAINQLFERIVPIIHRHGGRVDKFVGDGLLAVFGAPRRQPDHADQALAAALEIAEVVGSGEAGPLQIGVGLNSGTVVAGNIGGDRRYEFSVIGDAVNVAARVEAATRQTGDIVLLTEGTAALLKREGVELDERPGLELKGKRDAVPVYAPKARAADTSPTPG